MLQDHPSGRAASTPGVETVTFLHRPPGPGPAGHALLELAVVVTLLGAFGWHLVEGARRLAHRSGVEGARNEVAALLVRARRTAILEGGAVVVVTRDPPRAHLRTLGGETRAATPDLEAAYGTTLEHGGRRNGVVLRWDALGLGRMASRTLLFRRGEARAELVVSAYGRVRRR